MGNICSCLCPKRRSNTRTAYDIHQQTFQMQQQIGSMNIDQSSPNQNQKILTDQLSQQNRQSMESLVSQNKGQFKYQSIQEGKNNLRNLTQEENLNQNNSKQRTKQNKQKKFIQEKNKQIMAQNQYQQLKMKNQTQYDEIGSSKDMVDKRPNLMQIQQPKKEIRQKSPQPQPVIVKQQQKKPNPNILKPKTVKKKYNPDDYQFKGQTQSFRVKKVDSIKCQQYNIDNCNKSQYYIFDITANVYIDDTNDCKIYIAPCESTIFVRNCKNLIIIAATKQFRTYECHGCIFSLHCKSQPVIQSSSNLTFVPFEAKQYTELKKQLNVTKLQIWNNHWSQIHNFTKKVGQQHHSLRRNLHLNQQFNWKRAFQQAQLEQMEQNVSHFIPFIQGDLPCQKLSKFIILFNKQISKNTDSDKLILQKVSKYTILKSFKGKINGYGKEDRIALLLGDARQSQELIQSSDQQHQSRLVEQFKQLGQVYSKLQQVQKYQAQFFISFSDQREK